MKKMRTFQFIADIGAGGAAVATHRQIAANRSSWYFQVALAAALMFALTQPLMAGRGGPDNPALENPCEEDPNCCEDGEPGCCGGVPLGAGQGCCNGQVYNLESQCCKNGEIVTETGPHYGEWVCSKQGKFPAARQYFLTVTCVGFTLNGWNTNPEPENGEKARDIEYDCPGNQSAPRPTKETVPVSYTRSDLTWEPGFPHTFTDAGVYTFIAKASAMSSDPLCEDIPTTPVAVLTVTVKAPLLTASATPNPVCPGETVTFSASANCAGGEYTWSGAVSGDGPEVSGSFDTPGWHSATVSYRLHEAVVSRPVSVFVKVPTVTASASPSPAYVGQTVTFSSSSDCNADFFEWEGAVGGNNPQESISFILPGTHTATAHYMLNGRFYSGSTSVEVLPVQVTASADPDPVCAGGTVTFSATGSPPGGTFSWSGYVSGGGPSKSAVATDSGWATVVYTSPQYFQSAPVSVPVTVRQPVLSAWVSDEEICFGEEVTFSASVDCPSPTGEWEWSGAVTGSLASASTVPDEGGFHTATVTYTDPAVGIEMSENVTVYVRSCIPRPDPEDPDAEPCSEDPAANHGEVWPGVYWSWYGKGYWWDSYGYWWGGLGYDYDPSQWRRYLWNGTVLPTSDPNRLLLVKNLPPKAPEGESSAQFYLPLGWRIVTHNTPRERDLSGKLRLLLDSGQSPTDAYDVEVASRDIDGNWLFDGNDQHIFEDYQIGDDIPVFAKGHKGCGVHTNHGGFELFRFTMYHPEALTLVAEVDPDPEPEGDGSPLIRTTLTFVSSGLTPDYNRDGKIDANDRERFSTVASEEDRSRFHFWVNDNQEKSESNGNDIPGAVTPDYSTKTVNTVRDLIDFFSVSLDIADLLETFDDPAEVEVLLLGPSVNRILYPATFAGIRPEESCEYLTDPAVASVLGTAGTQWLHEWTALSEEDIARVKLGKSVFLFEGRRAGLTFLRLQVRYEGAAVGTFNLPIRLSPVEQMFRHKNLLANGGGDGNLGRPTELFATGDGPPGFPDYEVAEKNLVFVHGYNVNPQQARGWHSALFRRFYWSGLNARFYGVTWYGSETQRFTPWGTKTPNFHTNVVNAFHTAHGLADFLTELSGPTVLAAHSLGNTLASSAILDHPGVNPSHYFLINAAVANEAYDSGMPVIPEMVNSVWSKNNYPPRLWATNWHQLFAGSSDMRQNLSWRGRFEDLPNKTTVWNFRSEGDQVFKTHTGNAASPLGRVGEAIWETLISGTNAFKEMTEAFAMQEKFKGRNWFTEGVLGSNYGGWGVSREWEIWVDRRRPGGPSMRRTIVARRFDGLETGNPPLTDVVLETKPFFNRSKVPQLYSSSPGAGHSFLSTIDENNQRWEYRVMAQMIPAVTNGTGRFLVDGWEDLVPPRDYDMNVHGRTGPIGNWAWPDDRENNDWLHSDFKNVSYLYTYEMFDELLDRGEIKIE